MKILLSLFLLVTVLFNSFSQGIPIPTTNTSWMFTTSSSDDGGNYVYRGYILSTANDTIINDLPYTNLNLTQNWEILNFFGYFTDDTNYDLGHIAAFRQDSGRVYIYEYDVITDQLESGGGMFPYDFPIPNDTDFLLYDFNLEVGDTLSYLGFPASVVYSIEDTLLADGLLHKKINFNGDDPEFQSWIEGVGSTLGFLPSYLPLHQVFHNSYRLDCFSSNAVYLYGEDHCELVMVSDVENESATTIEVNPTLFHNQLSVLNLNSQFENYINVCNIEGKSIFAARVLETGMRINTTNWISGVYFVTIYNTRSDYKVFKIIKM